MDAAGILAERSPGHSWRFKEQALVMQLSSSKVLTYKANIKYVDRNTKVRKQIYEGSLKSSQKRDIKS